MVILVIAVTLLTVATAAVLPLWSTAMQRDKEDELIFRGLQYAEAVRLFQARNGRYPVRLEELIEVKPRCIRQLYPNPMSEDGEWELVFANTGQPSRNPQLTVGGDPSRNPRPDGPQLDATGDGQGRPTSAEQDAASRGSDRGVGGLSGTGGSGSGLGSNLEESDLRESQSAFGGAAVGGKRQRTGPIIGVFAKSDETSIKTFMGQQTYEQWIFTVEMVAGHLALPDRAPLVPSAATLGRPYLDGIEPLIKIPTRQEGQGGGGQGGVPGQPGPPGAGQPLQPGQPGAAPGGGRPANPFGVPGGLPGQQRPGRGSSGRGDS